MSLPISDSGIVQRGHLAGLRIYSFDPGPLEFIALAAGKPKVIAHCGAPSGLGDDVFHDQRGAGQEFV